MADRTKALLFERSLACFGIVGRSMSHDIANVLATINESAGLVEDYLAAAEQGASLDSEKLARVTERIGRQVERGEAYVSQLNRFAHTMDHPRESIDVGASVEAVVGLCERFARLRKVSLRHAIGDQVAQVEGSAFELQHTLFRAVELVLLATPPGGSITVAMTVVEQGVRVDVAGSEPADSAADLKGMGGVLAVLVGVLRGQLEQRLDGGRQPLVAVTLPRQLGSLWPDEDG
jgi:signal transduction histidine kinase